MANCNGNCASCSGCGRELTLTKEELDFLRELGTIPFLPVGRRPDDPTPICPGGNEETSQVLLLLEKKGLISLDYDKPLSGASEEEYRGCPLRGSMALTARGCRVLELLEYQGAEE